MLIETLSFFHPNISYCEKYNCVDHMAQPIDCPGKELPVSLKQVCRCGREIQKTHDFDLEDLVLTGSYLGKKVKTLVLIRHPIPAIISRWKLIAKTQNLSQKTEADWQRFFEENLQYYVGFCQKWIKPATPLMDKKGVDHVYTTYEQMTSDPDCLVEAMKFLTPNRFHIYLTRKNEEIFSFIHKDTNKHKDFKFYDEYYFQEKISNVDLSHL